MSAYGPGDNDKDNDRDISESVWDSYAGAVRDGYSKDDAARDTGSSRAEVDQAWSDAAADGAN